MATPPPDAKDVDDGDQHDYPPVATVAIRDQYTIIVANERLKDLVKALQEDSEQVYPNVTSTIQRLSESHYIIEAIVGTVDPDNIYSGGAGPPTVDEVDVEMTTSNQANALVAILESMGADVEYTITKAVQVMNTQELPRTPGHYLKMLNALSSAGVAVLSSYSGPAPYVLSPVLCAGSVLEYQMGTDSCIFSVDSREATRAYRVLSGVVGIHLSRRGKSGGLSRARKHHRKGKQHRAVD